MINAAIEDCTISYLGVVVLDEIHMIDDDHRGYIMELMATKLLALGQDTQIIGMSATLSVSSTNIASFFLIVLLLTPPEHGTSCKVAKSKILYLHVSTHSDRRASSL